jgi:hypothetical protein
VKIVGMVVGKKVVSVVIKECVDSWCVKSVTTGV